MADKTTHYTDHFQFHPCDTPRGMEFYDLASLTEEQQQFLNNHKVEVIRENQKYLYKNPEVRGVLQVILRKLLLERPSHDIEKFIGEYVSQNWDEITKEVDKYVEKIPRKPLPAEIKSTQYKEERHVTLDVDVPPSTSSKTSLLEGDALKVVTEILEDILDEVDLGLSPHLRKVHTADSPEVVDEGMATSKGELDEDDELIFDLGLDFDLDFSAYHEEDDHDAL